MNSYVKYFPIILATELAQAANFDFGELASNGSLSSLPMLIVFITLVYFMIIRPQAEANKRHKKLVESLELNNEIKLTCGIIGTVKDIHEQYLSVEIAENILLTVDKNAISKILPQNTIEQVKS